MRGITQLSGWIEEDLKDQLSSQTSEYIDLLKNRTLRLEKLLDDLLIYSRIGRKEGSYETFIVKERIESLFSLLSPPAGFELHCDDRIGQLTTLSTPFDQVMRNLLGNAIKHHDRSSGRIKVTAGMTDDRYVFTVEDDGPGIPPEHQQRSFELFHTLKPRDEVEGSGMGLSIIKKILDRYGCDYRPGFRRRTGNPFSVQLADQI